MNFRAQDKETLDAAVQIAKDQGSNLTEIIRIALKEYTEARAKTTAITRIDDFLDKSRVNPQLVEVLNPSILKEWPDGEAIRFAKLLRARMQEIDFELRRRGFYFDWR